MNRVVRCVISLTLWLCVGVADAAEIYQWRDEHGRMQFSDTPPANQKVDQVQLDETVTYDAAGARVAAPAYSRGAGHSADNSRFLKEQRAAAVAREARSEQLRKQQCEQIRDRYRRRSQKLSASIESAVVSRDKKNELRNQILEWCH